MKKYILLLVFVACVQFLKAQTTITIPIKADAQLFGRSDLVDTNFGSTWTNSTVKWTKNNVWFKKRFLIQPDLSSIPDNAIIASAVLKLYNTGDIVSSQTHSTLGMSNSTNVYRVSENWDEGLVTWNNQPAYEGTVWANLPKSVTGYDDYEVDITNLIQTWMNGTYTNYGMMFILANESMDEYAKLNFCTRENTREYKRPVLEITYYEPTTIQVGTGTTITYAHDHTIVTPFGTLWHDNKSQYLIKAEELSELGFSSGNILSLGFNVQSFGGLNLSDMEVSIGSTAVGSLSSSSFISGLTTVYSGNWNVVEGWNTIVFNNSYYWDGVSNIVLEVCFNNSSYELNSTVKYTTTSFYSCNGRYNDYSTGCSFTSPSSRAMQRPNMKIGVQNDLILTSTAVSQSQSYSSTIDTGYNYVRTVTPIIKGFDETDLDSTYQVGEVNEDIAYYDGLGRPIETINVKASPQGKDIVSYQTYDAYGRSDKSYVPIAISGNNGDYVDLTTITSNISTFLEDNYDVTTEDKSYGFATQVYESSPLNRVLKQGAPGKDWQPGQHPVEFEYGTNTSAITSWKYDGDTYTSFNYVANTLYVNTTIDEDGDSTKTYTDKLGNVVMKESYDGQYWLKTRYCYDDFNLLRCVLQPMATDPSEEGYCFYYNYDGRKRMIKKKVPGASWVKMVYDKRNLLVLTTDGNMEADNLWNYTKYDDLNRPVENGIVKISSLDHDGLRTYYKDKTGDYPNVTYIAKEKLYYDSYPTETKFSRYSFMPNAYVSTNDKTESPNGLLVAKCYTQSNSSLVQDNLNFVEQYYYDKYDRVIQSYRTDIKGKIERTSNKLSFTGLVDTSYTEYASGGFTNLQYYVLIGNSYDHRSRLLSTTYSVYPKNGAPIEDITVLANNYNEAGMLIEKYLHSTDGNKFMQKTDYTYNIRGWLTSINDPGLSSGEADVFGEHLYYNTTSTSNTSCYNGNISSMRWGGVYHRDLQYNYKYKGNKLYDADFIHPDYNASAYTFYTGYDKNGNFTAVLRGGNRLSGTGSGYVDLLSYTYESNSNRIKSIKDTGTNESSDNYPDSDGSLAFTYDANGNLTKEPNRGVDIEYNLLNLSVAMDFNTNQSIHNSYDVYGTKYSTTVNNDTEYNTTYYSGMFVLTESNAEALKLSYIMTPEGRLVNIGTDLAPDWQWEYNITDHIGNVRAVITPMENNFPKLLQESHYYPFGMRMAELCYNNSVDTDNKYLYNGKELTTDFDLGWYDYGNRFYDAAIGRWHTQDLMAEFYYDQSPYNYVGNDPMSFIDPNGDFKTKFGAWWHKVWNGGDGIGKDKGGEYFVYTQSATEDDEGGVTVTSTRVFDKNGRSEGKDLAFEKKKAEYIKMLEHEAQIDKWVAQGIYDRSLTVSEVRQNMINDFALVAMPNILKTTSTVTNSAKSGISSVDDLLNAAGQLKRVKGAKQGFVSGNAQKIFNSLIKGGTKVRGNLYKLKDGTLVNFHKSTTTGIQTIDINKAGQVFKIRIQ